MRDLQTLFLGIVAGMAIIAAFTLGSIEDKLEQSTIGGTVVPVVQCAEDEVITWLGPDTLGCVHYENVR